METSKWFVTGATGQLGSHVIHALQKYGIADNILAVNRNGDAPNSDTATAAVDLQDTDALRACAVNWQPTHFIHLGGMTSVGEAHQHPDAASRVNVDATKALADVAAEFGARFVFSSTDMVFDGRAAPYREDAATCPLSHYGRTKAAAEEALLRYEHALVVRLPLMYGFPRMPRITTFTEQITALRDGRPLRLFHDEYRTPIWLADAANAIIALAQSDSTGLIHVAGPERLSRYEMAARFADLLDIHEPDLEQVSRLSINSPESRPADLSLDSSLFASQFPNDIPGSIRAEVFHAKPQQ